MSNLKQCCTCKKNKKNNNLNFCNNKNTLDGLSDQCKQCAKEYRDSHKEEVKNYPSSQSSYRKKYLADNNEHINEQRRGRYSKNKEKYSERNKKWFSENREEILSKQRENYRNNTESYSQYNKKWRDKNKDYILLKNRQREHKLNDFPKIKQKEINKLLQDHDNKCFYCKVYVKRGVNLHIDHVVPLSAGGPHIIDNLVPACKTCNLKKGKKSLQEFLNKIGENK